MSSQAFWVAAALAVAIGVLGAMGTGTRSASASIPGDVCSITAWDSTGAVLPEGSTVGGNGSVYLVFRVEDDPFGYVNDFVLDGPVQELIGLLEAEIADLQAQIDALDPEDEDDANEIAELEAEIVALEEVLFEYNEAIEGILDTDLVMIDSSTGSAAITSKAEVVGFEWVKPNIDHVLILPGVLSQRVDHMFPDFFNNPDGADLDSISAWATSVAGAPSPGSFGTNVCGGSTVDGWGFVDLHCTAPGRFRVNVIPQRETSENTRGTIDLYCPSFAETAEIAASPTTLETDPVGASKSSSLITVTVEDTEGDNVDGAQVAFTTDNCTFSNPYEGDADDSGMTPAGGGAAVTVWSDSDSTSDSNFLANNPAEHSAGTAEVSLDCAKGSIGSANITAVVERMGADIVLHETITVVGPTSATGLTLTLTPNDFECGDTLLATANAVDGDGQLVSNGTQLYFTTDTSSGVVGGEEGAQGGIATVGGSASVFIATDPGNPGVHTVIVYALKANSGGDVVAQASANYTCEAAVAPAAPTVAPPATGTGTGSITPPNTGDAGLASATGGTGLWLAVIALAGIMFSGLGLVAVRAR